MKKILIASIALAASLAAFAQSDDSWKGIASGVYQAGIPDYSLETNHTVCFTSAGEGFCKFPPLNIKVGADVSQIVLAVEPYYNISDDMDIKKYLTSGTTLDVSWIPLMGNMYFPMAANQFGTNRWGLILLALDSKGNIQNHEISTFFTPENDADWYDYAKCDYTDLVVSPTYASFNPTVEVMVQRKKGDGCKLRVVNPFAGNPEIKAEYAEKHAGHHHFLYIDASDPDFVYIEESPMGLDGGHGDIVASSAVGAALSSGQKLSDLKAAAVPAGRLDDDVITMPEGAVKMFETRYLNSELQPGASGRLLLFREFTGVENVSVEPGNLPAVYYNLNGSRVNNPAHGQIYIRVQGAKSAKVVY